LGKIERGNACRADWVHATASLSSRRVGKGTAGLGLTRELPHIAPRQARTVACSIVVIRSDPRRPRDTPIVRKRTA
jgi:hypothetical protein